MPGARPRAVARHAVTCLLAAVALSACAGSEDGGRDPSESAASPSASTAAAPLELDVVIDSGQVSPTIDRVPLDIGDAVRLSVTSDSADVIHVHGVDRTLDLEAGVPGVLNFVVPPGVPRGVYTVETHGGGLILFEIKIR
jgi:hypothetical protein